MSNTEDLVKLIENSETREEVMKHYRVYAETEGAVLDRITVIEEEIDALVIEKAGLETDNCSMLYRNIGHIVGYRLFELEVINAAG